MLMLEPRGHDGMYGVLIVEKNLPEADMAVLFLHGEGKIVYYINFNINPSHNFFLNQIMYMYVATCIYSAILTSFTFINSSSLIIMQCAKAFS